MYIVYEYSVLINAWPFPLYVYAFYGRHKIYSKLGLSEQQTEWWITLKQYLTIFKRQRETLVISFNVFIDSNVLRNIYVDVNR